MGVNLTIGVQDATTGEALEVHELHNLVTNAGLDLLRDLLNEATDQGLTHLGVGSGSTAAAPADTALQAELLRDTFTKRTNTGTGAVTLTYFLGSTAANGSTLREAGLFTAVAAGTLFARAVHEPIAKTSAITVTYTWQVTFTAI